MITSFDHVAITVKDFEKTIDWYIKNLGFSIQRSSENKERGTKMAFLETRGKVMLEIFGFIDPNKVVEGPILKNEETGMKHIAFNVEKLDELCQKLKNAGVEFVSLSPTSMRIKDLNGILIELRGTQ
ncbi:MAG: glyoxylase family protein [Thermoproteota archaeon]|nr:glyoxylase family protein [Thermoproteota archaeon]